MDSPIREVLLHRQVVQKPKCSELHQDPVWRVARIKSKPSSLCPLFSLPKIKTASIYSLITVVSSLKKLRNPPPPIHSAKLQQQRLRSSRITRGLCLVKLDERGASLAQVARTMHDALDDGVDGAANQGFHLHALNDEERLVGVDGVAGLDMDAQHLAGHGGKNTIRNIFQA